MRLSDFDYDLPPASIARFPTPERDASRLLALDRHTGAFDHHRFAEVSSLLRSGDLLVVNDTRVRPARLFCRKPTGGRVEVLLVEPEDDAWLALAKSNKALQPGTPLTIEGGTSVLTVLERRSEGWIKVALDADVDALTQAHGQLPLPPYMGRSPEVEDKERYQTIFARPDRTGSVAAPTAGLHFTPEVMAALEAKEIRSAAVTLHVGPGTFLPVRTDDPDEHQMHQERFELSSAAADAIRQTRAEGGRIVAVGTTVTRVLESVDDATRAQSGATSLFIRPGFTFRHVDALITNFHLPRSTLLMLVCAFAGREAVLAAYEAAAKTGYRFYSYGDAMLIQ
ncbi:MAG: tRNA preQ1(34) S-adenosylmethionine ribosyltransferase-isomerase QueA [Myxococcota bacterium]